MKNSDMTFFSHPVVNDICDFIQLSLDPWDGEAFLRIYYKMGAGISKKAAMEAVDANTRRLTLLDTVAEMDEVSVYTRNSARHWLPIWTICGMSQQEKLSTGS